MDELKKINLSTIQKIWELELFNSGTQSVRLNQIIIAIFVIIIGAVLSSIITKIIKRRLVNIVHITASTAYVIQKVLYYIFLVFLVFVALSIAGIPVTIFTVVGGALAIGIGFGAQNLFNNLISSFIILFEQPIRIGDIVEIADQEGRIEEIGSRRVRIRRVDGVDLLIPNSFFLERMVINWTLSNWLIRGNVQMGVAYGSDVDLVNQLIIQAANDHDRVLPHPRPVVLFDNFGDSALIFSLLFWSKIKRPMDLRIIQSDLRYAINSLFGEHGIVIAFPQRDVHISSMDNLKLSDLKSAPNTKKK